MLEHSQSLLFSQIEIVLPYISVFGVSILFELVVVRQQRVSACITSKESFKCKYDTVFLAWIGIGGIVDGIGKQT